MSISELRYARNARNWGTAIRRKAIEHAAKTFTDDSILSTLGLMLHLRSYLLVCGAYTVTPQILFIGYWIVVFASPWLGHLGQHFSLEHALLQIGDRKDGTQS